MGNVLHVGLFTEDDLQVILQDFSFCLYGVNSGKLVGSSVYVPEYDREGVLLFLSVFDPYVVVDSSLSSWVVVVAGVSASSVPITVLVVVFTDEVLEETVVVAGVTSPTVP